MEFRPCLESARAWCQRSWEYCAVHVVRDPTQVLISGYLYHRRLPGDESWLFEPSPELGGGTYAERLASADQLGPTNAMLAEIAMADVASSVRSRWRTATSSGTRAG